METVSKQFDENLAHLAWSLWTELGVRGIERKHQAFSIAPEELILLTSVISEFDPRLRDEALDWCIHYHRFISPVRLHIIVKKYGIDFVEPFSTFSATFNSIADIRTKWVVPTNVPPLKFRPSGKSILRGFEADSMIHFRLRAFFGMGARSDILAFLLTEGQGDFAISDFVEIGYSKRHIAEILSDLAQSGILLESQIRNQLRYTFAKRDKFIKLLGGIPKKMIHWHRILGVLLPIRACLQRVEDSHVGVRAVDMRNLLNKLKIQLSQLQLTPPPMQKDLDAYWVSVTKWILSFSADLAQGVFKA